MKKFTALCLSLRGMTQTEAFKTAVAYWYDQTGNINLSIIMGIVTIAIAFIVFPIILTAAHTILNDANIADFTGLSAIAAVAPLVIFVGMLFGGGLMVWKGARGKK